MTEAQAIEAIVEHWESGWEGLHPADPDDPDHVPFTLDNEAALATPSWVRVTIIPTLRPQTTLGRKGSRRYEQRGYVAVQLFTDVDTGGLSIASLADDVRTVLEGEAIAVAQEQISLFEGASSGITTDGRWAMKVVTIPLMWQQVR